MSEKFSKKQEKIQEKIQKQQELNDKDCRELTDEELDQIVGGGTTQTILRDLKFKVTNAYNDTNSEPKSDATYNW